LNNIIKSALKLLLSISIVVSIFAFGYYANEVKKMKKYNSCVENVINKDHDMSEYYGHGAIPKPFNHAYALISMRLGECVFGSY
jgi:hypothetical protein